MYSDFFTVNGIGIFIFSQKITFVQLLSDGGEVPGKWVCDPHRIKILAEARKAKDPSNPGCVIYSIGSNGDFSFEVGMQKEVGEVCEIHIFDFGDFESKMVQSGLKNAHYHQWGLKQHGGPPPRGSRGGKFHSLVETVRLLGHEKLDAIDIFVSSYSVLLHHDFEQTHWSN